jgi:hypothetical protein
MTLQELMHAFTSLPHDQQVAFVAAAASVAEGVSDIEAAQIAEAEHRLAAYRKGEMDATPLQDFLEHFN